MSTTAPVVQAPTEPEKGTSIFTANRIAAIAAFLTSFAGGILAITNSFPKNWQATAIAIASIVGAVGTALHFMLGSQKNDANQAQVKLAQLQVEHARIVTAAQNQPAPQEETAAPDPILDAIVELAQAVKAFFEHEETPVVTIPNKGGGGGGSMESMDWDPKRSKAIWVPDGTGESESDSDQFNPTHIIDLPAQASGTPVKEDAIGSGADSDPKPDSGATQEFTAVTESPVEERPEGLPGDVPVLGPNDPPLESSVKPNPA